MEINTLGIRKPQVLQKNEQENKLFHKNNPVTKKALKIQAKLHRVLREARILITNQDIERVHEGTGKIWKLYSPENQTYKAFIKQGKYFKQGPTILEPLIWKIAVLFELEDLFVPTEKFVIEKFPQKIKHYSLQIAQTGKHLSLRDLKAPNTISSTSIRQAVLASLLFGMYDAHGKNILITKDGNIKFFDNSRSLPHSNGMILYPEGIVPAYCCNLLDLNQAKEPFTIEEIEELKKIINGYQKKLPFLKDFFLSHEIKQSAEKLPLFWLNLDHAYEALEQRVELVNLALSKAKNLEELVGYTIPGYKFAYALGCCYEYTHTRKIKGDHPHANCRRAYTERLFHSFTKQGIHLMELYEFCINPDHSFLSIENYVASNMGTDIHNDSKSIDGRKFFSQLSLKFKKDFKDREVSICNRFFLMEKLKIDFMENISSKKALAYVTNNQLAGLFFANYESSDPFIIFQVLGGYAIFNINLNKTRTVTFKNKQMSLNAFVEMLQEKQLPEAADLPFLNIFEINDFSNSLPTEQQYLFRLQLSKHLLILKKEGEHCHKFIFPQNENGMFLLYGEEASLEQIWNETKNPSSKNLFLLSHKIDYN